MKKVTKFFSINIYIISLIEIQDEKDLDEIFGKSGFEVNYYIKIIECFSFILKNDE